MKLIEDLQKEDLQYLIPASAYDDYTHEYMDGYDSPYGHYVQGCDFKYMTVEEMKEDFQKEELEDEDFLSLSIADLFGITPHQLKFIDADMLYKCDIRIFMEILHGNDFLYSVPDTQIRIKLATICSIYTDARLYIMCRREQDLSYILRIMKNRSITESIELIRDYIDYLGMRESALVINEEREEPKFDYKIYPKVSHIKDLHDKALRDYQLFEAKNTEVHKEEYDAGIKVITASPAYQKLLYHNKEYAIIAPACSDDLIKEGETLHHCIVSYTPAFAKGETWIYFLRRRVNPDIPYFTIEVKNHMITQVYGYENMTEKEPSCTDFLLTWKKLHHLHCVCTL